jgi:hypothetical protein
LESSALQGLLDPLGLLALHLPLPVLQGRQALLGRKVMLLLGLPGLLALPDLLGLLDRGGIQARLVQPGLLVHTVQRGQLVRKAILAHTAPQAPQAPQAPKALLGLRAAQGQPLQWLAPQAPQAPQALPAQRVPLQLSLVRQARPAAKA